MEQNRIISEESFLSFAGKRVLVMGLGLHGGGVSDKY